MLPAELTTLVALGSVGLLAVGYYLTKQKVAPFPPDPSGLPILGNVLDLPQSHHVLGSSIIVLNEVKHATAMLDNRSRIYSNRPTLIMGGELVGWDKGPALIQFGKRWLDYRRLMAQFLGTRSRVDAAYGPILEKCNQEFLRSVLRNPTAWKEHSRRFAGAIVLKIAYGYTAEEKHDPLVELVDEAMEQFSEMTTPNAFTVDTFPFLRFVPQWFPGTSWKKKAVHYHNTLQTMLDRPYEWVKNQMVTGTSVSCVVSDLHASQIPSIEEEKVIKWTAAGIYSAAIEAFFLAMTLQPEAQRKAQKELDSVLECTLPRLADRSRLPFTEALFSEVFRTHNIGPVGLPHVSTEDDIYEGFLIPKGTMIITNNWLFYRDSNTYADPETFAPERFIETSGHAKEKDPRDTLFGVHLADASMWIIFASILSCFNISAPVKDGKPQLPSAKFSDGSISRPEQFECVVMPRKGAEESIHRALDS
ncbi:cytochrome P450 [Mycena rebaudengoi]|nr:cytochrome P450 [Mycena rebaudengoi]